MEQAAIVKRCDTVFSPSQKMWLLNYVKMVEDMGC